MTGVGCGLTCCCDGMLPLRCLQLSGEFAAYKALLELFCYGNWAEYQGQCSTPQNAAAVCRTHVVPAHVHSSYSHRTLHAKLQVPAASVLSHQSNTT